MSSRPPCFHIFVYGTLRRRFRNPYALLLHRSSDFIHAARVRGSLQRFKRYTGICLDSSTSRWIPGEIFRFRDQRLLAALDRYEGPDYERVLVEAMRANGSRCVCWTYRLFPKRMA